MPGQMVHMLFARKVDDYRGALYFLGSVAPDAVSDWHNKDKTHFRNLSDRTEAMINLAENTDINDDFAEGVLTHLYLDWKWDLGPRDNYVATLGDDWFVKYRREISLSGQYIYHHNKWARDMWKSFAGLDIRDYGETPGATRDELCGFIERITVWFEQNNGGPSDIYTPEFIDEFTSKTAEEYKIWRRSI